MVVWRRYAIYDYGTKIGEYTSEEIKDKLGMSRILISKYSELGLLYKGRYLFERIDQARLDPLLREWDEVRIRILTAGRRRSWKCKTIK